MNTQLGQQGSANITQDTTSQVDQILNGLSTSGVNGVLDQFFSAWQDVGNAPSDPAARAALDQARAAGIPLSPLRAHEALLDALAGDTAAARSALADVPASAMTADPSIAEVVRATHDLLARSRK